jgi:membrane protein YqaA with SNARE-associated domain
MFAWALAEATVWPIIPDALLVPLVVGAPRRLPRLWLAAVAGSTLGGAAGYAFAWWRSALARRILERLPGVQPRMLERTAALLAERGPSAFWLQPWTGMALKIFCVLGAAQHVDPRQALPISVAARALRLGVTGAAAALCGWRLRRFVRDRSLVLALAYLLVGGVGWWATQIKRLPTTPGTPPRMPGNGTVSRAGD